MATGKVLPTLVALVVFLNSALALPLKTCPAFECTGSNDVFAFEPKKIYSYHLETQTSSVLSGATVPQGKLHLTSEVTVQAVSPCSAILTVKKATVINGEKKHLGAAAIEGSPVLIGVQNGQLVSEFCANKADSITSLNVKRAIASLFQVPVEQKQYTDIFGTCEISSTVLNGADGTTEINSFRNLNSCKHRESIISSIPSSSYDFDAPEQSNPIIKSSARLEQRLKNKVLEAASGHEEYHFVPYSNQGNGAIITVSTNITLTGTADGDAQFAASAEPTSVSVIFEAPHGSSSDYSSGKAINAAVEEACKAIEAHSVDSAHYVRSLIQVIRQSSAANLLQVYNTNSKNPCGGKLMLDALINAATGQTVEALVKLAKSKALDLDQFYTSLAFNRHPTLASIKAITTLIEKGNPARNLILGAGSLVGKYNEEHGIEGAKEIDTLLERIARPLENCNANNHEQEDKILTALKGIHNAHYIPDSVADKLKECASRKYSTRVRAAVIDSIQSDAGNAKLKPTILEILEDREEDSELRIKAYLVAATCPCGKVFESVSKLVQNEPVNQVGSFIATHLRNLRASANPDKAGAKAILGSIRVPANKYKYDYRRFSTNTELSFSLGKEGVAASAESNVIFSQKSFLPRSTDLNLTANVLGHSFNLLEVGLRAENLEHILETYFGPKGYFKTHSPNDVVTTGNETVNNLAQKIKERAVQSIQSTRNKRSVDRSSLEKMSAKVKLEDDDNINIDVYLKLFGYELAFYSYYGNPTEFTPAGIVDKIFDRVDSTIDKAKDYNLNIDKNVQLFDTEFTYPTFAGFPLKLTSAATAAIKVELKTHFDLQAIVRAPQQTDIAFKFIPSATVEASSEFFVDFYIAASGLKHAATIHTSNGVDLTFKILNGKGFDLNIGTPLAQQEILHVKSDLFSVSRDKGFAPVQTPIVITIPKKQYYGCFDQLSPFIGVTFCGDLSFPNEGVPKKGPFFPLDGPAEYYVLIKKDDPALTAYNINAQYHDEDPNVKGWSLQFSTPRASSERLVKFLFTLAQRESQNEAKLEFITPIKSGYAAVTLIEDKQEKAIDAILKMDADEYKAKVGLTVIESSDAATTYKPQLTYSGPGDDGSNKQYTVDGVIKHEKSGSLDKLTFTAVAVTIPKNKYQLDGFAGHSNTGFDVDLVAKYNNLAETVALKSKYERTSDKAAHFDIEFKASKYPEAAFAANYDGKRDELLVDNKLKVYYGTDLKNEDHSVTIEQHWQAEKSEEKIASFSTKNKLSIPGVGIFLHYDADGVRDKSVHFIAEVGYEKQRLTSELNYKFNIPGPDGQKDSKDPGGFELLLKAGAAGKVVTINSNRVIETPTTSKTLFSVDLQPENKVFKIESDLIHKVLKNDVKLMITSVVSITGFPDTYTVCTGVENTPEQSQGHLQFSKGSVEIFKVKGEAKHGDTETGKFEVFLKDFLDGTGTFSHTKSKNEGTIDSTFNSQKLNRKVVVTGKLAPGAKATVRELSVNVLLDADKNPSNKVSIDSSLDLNKDGRSYDTKTTISIIDSTFVISLKGVVPNRTPLENGVMSRFDGSLELPSKQVISAYADLVQLQESQGKGTTALIKFDDGKDYKLKYSGKYASVDGFAVATFDVDTNLELNSAQKNLVIAYNIKNTPGDNTKTIVHKIDVTGSAIPQPFSSIFTAEIQDTPKYHLTTRYGEKVAVDAETSFNFKNRKDQSYDLSFNLKSDFEGYKQVKYTSSYKGSIDTEASNGNARDFLEIENARVYDISAHYDYVHTASECKGNYKLTSLLGAEEKDPREFSFSHEYTGPTELKVDTNRARKFTGTVGLSQGSTAFGLKFDAETPGDGTTSGKFGITLDTPIENYKTIVLKLDHKSQNSGKLIEADVELNFDNNEARHYLLHGKADLSEVSRVFSVQITKFDKTPIFKTHASYQRPSSNEIQGELNINVGGAKPFNLAVNGVAKYPGGFDEFDVVVNLDSEDLKLSKVRVHLDGKNQGAKGRKINVSIKSAEKTYIEGSTTFQKKDDGTSTVYEGKGEVELNGDKYSSDIRLAHRVLQKAKDSETGFDITLNGVLTGKLKRTIDAQFLLTDKALRTYTKYCNDKCSQVDVGNTLKITDATELHVENKVSFDFEHTPNPFALNINSKLHRKGLAFEHRIEAELGKAEKSTKYVYEALLKDRSLGLHLITPKRTIAIDGVFSTPEKAKSENSQSYKAELTAYLDKANEPDKKLTLLSSLDVNKGKDGTIYTSDLKISHPLIGKDLVFKSKNLIGTGQVLLDSSFTLDVFAKKNQAIVFSIKNERVPIDGGFNMTSTLTITSKAQGLDVTTVNHFVATKKEVGFGSVITCKSDNEVRETAAIFAASIDSLLIFVGSPSCEILRIHGDCKRQTGIPPKANVYLSFLDTINFEGEVIGYQSFKYQAYDKNQPEIRTVYSGAFELEKELLLEADHLSAGSSAKLFRLRVALDKDNFLQTEQTLDPDQLKVALDRLQTIGKSAADRLTQCVTANYKVAETRAKSILEGLKKSQPNLKPLIDRCKAQFEALQTELRADPTINEIFEVIQNLVGGLTQTVTKFLQTLGEYVEKVTTVLKEWASKFAELINKLTPVFTEAIGNVSKALSSTFTTFLEIFTKLAGKVLEAIKANSGDIQKIFGLFAEFIKDQSKIVGEIANELSTYVNELIKTIIKQLESQPFLDKIKERYEEFYKLFLERFDGVFAEIADNLKEILPNQELKELADAFVDYITKKVKGQPVDDIAELKKLTEKLVKAFTALVNLPAASGIPGIEGLNLENILKFSVTPANFDSLIALPQFTSFRASLLELLGANDLPSAAEIFFTYSVPRRFDDAVIPYRAFGQISGSKHFYTFDGDHYTLKGDCQYLLAKDFDDGNFSLTVELAGNELRSVAYIDAKDNVEIKADHSVLVNGQVADLPFHQNDVSIYRTLNAVNLKSKYGVEIVCDLHHDLCSFAVNGYYFGKTRGLLGTITNEKFDDWTLPNGKIATTVSQFSNAYMLSDSCQNQVPVEHKHNTHAECANAFTAPASFSECFSFVDRTPYRQGCEDAFDDAQTPEQKSAAICDAAAAYVSKCRDATFLLPTLPLNCAQCSLGATSINVGKTAVVKTAGKVDAVILVEQVSDNEVTFKDLVLPLAAQVKVDLTSKGFTDIRSVLIGYGAPGQQWPSLYTTDGKFIFDSTNPPKQLKFGASESGNAGANVHPLLAFLNRAKEYSALELGLTPLAQAFRQVIEFPFRPDAAKAVILVRSSECHKTKLPVSLQQLTFLQARNFFKDRGIVVGLVQPIDITTTAAEKKIIGFDSEAAITYTKKGVDPNGRSEINYSSDSCAPYIDTVKPLVLSSKIFNELKAGPRKQFIQSASSRFASLLAVENTQNCDCVFHEGLHAQTRCSVSATKQKGKKN
ncbi:apolipophorins [Neocloeon triangulifer]|uniref:apolipophorins n=1 Tax=Neocloeon triangulifer TaxID=2078957 RepID=UPI00286F635F|nr:apolipophorins [Neocloeon triangulifer]